mmetsp:Transcript_12598/g.38647  ORF Transcript_12598/g.38647 Transcript_12598/m.38647 type:complete len:231 (+) Transcript_12598:72-764(+)
MTTTRLPPPREKTSQPLLQHAKALARLRRRADVAPGPERRLVAVARHQRALSRRGGAALAEGFLFGKRRRGPHAADAHVLEVRVPQEARVVFLSFVAVRQRLEQQSAGRDPGRIHQMRAVDADQDVRRRETPELVAERARGGVLHVIRLEDETDARPLRRRGDRRLELVDVAQVALDASAAADLGPSLDAYDVLARVAPLQDPHDERPPRRVVEVAVPVRAFARLAVDLD